MRLFAYIDPGTGSLFLQTLIGVVLGAAVVFKNFFVRAYYKLKSLFTRQTTTNEEK